MSRVHCSTDQDGSVHLVSICFDLGVGNGVVVQHRLQVGPVGRKVWKEHSLNSLQTETQTNTELKFKTIKKLHGNIMNILYIVQNYG